MKVGNIVPYIESIIPVIRILTKIPNLVNLHLGLILYSTVINKLSN